jgi:UDPglucose 6-dehydrogenase
VKALVRTLEDNGVDAGLMQAVESINRAQKQLALEWTDARLGQDLTGKQIAVWGLSFKPETDDMREAPALVVIDGLLRRGARVSAHDPEAMHIARSMFGDRVALVDSNYDAIDGAEALIILTEWKPYRNPDFARMKRLMKKPLIFDGRNLFDADRMHEHGFDYTSIGRPRSVDAHVTMGALASG